MGLFDLFRKKNSKREVAHTVTANSNATGIIDEHKAQIVSHMKLLHESTVILKDCQSPEQIRSGMKIIANLFEKEPSQTDLVYNLKNASEPGALDDEQIIKLKYFTIEQFNKQFMIFNDLFKKIDKI